VNCYMGKRTRTFFISTTRGYLGFGTIFIL
jgi:hypothetical protein